MYKTRKERLRPLLTEAQVDAFVFFGLPNIRYLCGFTGSDGVLIVTATASSFLSDSRYQTQAAAQVDADAIVCYQKKLDGIAAELHRLGVQRAGFESEILSVDLWQQLEKKTAGELEWIPVGKPLRMLRGAKDASELELLRQAADLNRQAFAEIEPMLMPGTSEREISLALEFFLKRNGGEAKAFDYIVASGSRGALPHGLASEKLLATGELVTVDFGTRIDGYHSDETVTVAIGTISEKKRQIYDTVLAAHDLALAAVRPGLSVVELDAVARDYIGSQGYGDYFGHGLGHGVGLEIHEYPSLSPKGEGQLVEGMVITIEPGIYLPDCCGVRIEDTVLVTADGFECLTGIDKQLRQFPA